jgi:hypothetical protein
VITKEKKKENIKEDNGIKENDTKRKEEMKHKRGQWKRRK